MSFDEDTNSEINVSNINSIEDPKSYDYSVSDQINLVDVTFIDAKNLKKFYHYSCKVHSDVVLEFYKSGIWSKMARMSSSGGPNSYELVSSVKFPAQKLFHYCCNAEHLPDYDEDDPDSNVFYLVFKSSDFLQFFKSTGANNHVTLKYQYGSDKAFMKIDGKSGSWNIDVKFFQGIASFPAEGPITSDELLPAANIISSQFIEISTNITKFSKKQSGTHEYYIDFQIDEVTASASYKIHSTKGKFQDNSDDYNHDVEHDIRFIITHDVMSALSCLPKVNEKGFISLYFVDDKILRISVQVGNFAQYDGYIVTK